MNEPQRTWQTVAGLLLLCFLLYFWELGQIPFYNYEESKEALIVWEMVNDGGWILPLRNGTEIPLKPPLFHWCGALIAWISGKANEFAVRSPSAFFSTGSVLMIFFFGQRVWRWRVGLLASLVAATSPEWLRWATYARSDMVLVFFLTAAGFMFFRVWEERATQRGALYLFYLFVGLATLAKGPLGIVLPALVSFTFLLFSRDLRFIRQLRLLEGAIIITVIAISWYLLALEQAGWTFFRRQILNENIYRFFESEQGGPNGPSRDHSWYYYILALFAGTFPWSLFFPALAHFLYRSRKELQEPKSRYLLIWVIVGLIFFTLASGKRTNYLLPLYPPIALLFALWWEELVEGKLASSVLAKPLARVNAFVLCALFALVLLFLTAHSAGFDLDHMIAPFLHPRDQENIPLVAYSLQSQFFVVLIWLLMLAISIGWYFWGLRKDQWMYVFAALMIATSSSLYFTNALFHPLLAQERTFKPFMLGVRSTVKNAPLYFYKDAYDYGAIFYANRHIPLYTNDLAALKVEEDPASPAYLLMWEEEWQTLSAVDQRFEYLVTSEGRGPDKRHRLVLAVLLPGHEHKKEQNEATEHTPPTSPTAAPKTNGPLSEPGQVLPPPAVDFQQKIAPEAMTLDEPAATPPSATQETDTLAPQENPPTVVSPSDAKQEATASEQPRGGPATQPANEEGENQEATEVEETPQAAPKQTKPEKKSKRRSSHTKGEREKSAVHHKPSAKHYVAHHRRQAALAAPLNEQEQLMSRLTVYPCAPLLD